VAVSALCFAERELRLHDLRAWVLLANHVPLAVFPPGALWRITEAIHGFGARVSPSGSMSPSTMGCVAGWSWSELWGASDKVADPAGRLDKTGVLSHVPSPDAHSDSH